MLVPLAPYGRLAPLPLVVLLLAGASHAGAQSAWTVDAGMAAYTEAWDLNDDHEWLAGLTAGVDRGVWRGVAVRAEGALLRVFQEGTDTWLRAIVLGTRLRSGRAGLRPFVELGAGWSSAGRPVPARGTRGNYLLVAGGGLEASVGRRTHAHFGARWFHLSNNGREGRHRNPDVQALGLTAGLGWGF